VQCATRSGVGEAFSHDKINVSWAPTSDQRPASETITEHLEAGRYEEAIPLLEASLQLQPDDVESLTQLGMVKSDLGELVEARRLLQRAVALDPAHVNALVSLSVAASPAMCSAPTPTASPAWMWWPTAPVPSRPTPASPQLPRNNS
jgi:tetratricopeptide (TPR) repeat protein